jgi:hypothetical protein
MRHCLENFFVILSRIEQLLDSCGDRWLYGQRDLVRQAMQRLLDEQTETCERIEMLHIALMQQQIVKHDECVEREKEALRRAHVAEGRAQAYRDLYHGLMKLHGMMSEPAAPQPDQCNGAAASPSNAQSAGKAAVAADPEQCHVNCVAESQAPPLEGGDTGVAPSRSGVAPEIY